MYKQQWKTIPKIRWIVLLIISVIFALVQIATCNDWKSMGVDNLIYYFAPMDCSGIGGQVYLILFPLIALILSGNLYPKEKNSHRLLYDYSRINHKQWIKVTFINNFLMGMVSAVVPLLFNLLFALTKCHHLTPIKSIVDSEGFANDGFNTTGLNWAGDFFGVHSGWSILFALIVYAFYGGIFACLGMIAREFVPYKYSEYFVPFTSVFIWNTLVGFIVIHDISFSCFQLNDYLAFTFWDMSKLVAGAFLFMTILFSMITFMGYRRMIRRDILD